MPLTFRCSTCLEQLFVPDNLSGQQVRCGKCATVLTVPANALHVSSASPPAPIKAAPPKPAPKPPAKARPQLAQPKQEALTALPDKGGSGSAAVNIRRCL